MQPQGFTSDFFNNQERARKKTGKLVLLFILAVVLIIVAVNAVFIVVLGVGKTKGVDLSTQQMANAMLLITAGTLFVIGLGSLFKILMLGKGGDGVAKLLGGRLVEPMTQDPAERRLINVVEEMSIASGVPVPRIYVMDDEDAINAFAAGYSPTSAVVGVTRGTIDRLSRGELQGVIAHEFSHILNGDMRLNIRLIGILHGILLIGITGRVLLRSMFYAGGGRSRRRGGKGSGQAAMVMLVLGLSLLAIGYIGVLIGSLIKAAVSRQREFLADASAVQFTRNPDGLGGALKKIGAMSTGARLKAAHAEQASHMFFGNALKSAFSGGMLATHPPLPERIKAIEPAWDGTFPVIAEPKETSREEPERRRQPAQAPGGMPFPLPIPGLPGAQGLPGVGGMGAGQAAAGAMGLAAAGAAAQAGGQEIDIRPEEIMSQVGRLTPDTIEHAVTMLSAIPDSVRMAARDRDGARAIVHASLLDEGDEIRNAQMNHLRANTDPTVMSEIDELLPVLRQLGPTARLTLLDLSLPAIKTLEPGACRRFLDNVDALIMADNQVVLFEFCMKLILHRHLEEIIAGKVDRSRPRYYSINAVVDDVALVMSALAHAGNDDMEEIKRSFAAGLARLGELGKPVLLLPKSQCGLEKVGDAIGRLRASIPGVKRRVVEGLTWCVAADAKITIEEAELLRAIADTLDCPLPPLVAPKR